MKQLIYTLFLLSVLIVISCNKDDIIETVTVKGNVKNDCIGKGFSNVEIKLFTKREKTFGKIDKSLVSTTSDANGNFYFSGVDINHCNEYSYSLSIENTDRYLLGEYGHSGGGLDLDKDRITDFIQIGLSSSFNTLKFYLPAGTSINNPDEFKLTIEQRTIYYFEPNRNWRIDFGTYTNINSISAGWFDYIGNYPMGWWHILITKNKGGVITNIHDSIFIDMGATASYTIPW